MQIKIINQNTIYIFDNVQIYIVFNNIKIFLIENKQFFAVTFLCCCLHRNIAQNLKSKAQFDGYNNCKHSHTIEIAYISLKKISATVYFKKRSDNVLSFVIYKTTVIFCCKPFLYFIALKSLFFSINTLLGMIFIG